MLLRVLLEEWNRKMKMLQKHYGIKKLGDLWSKKKNKIKIDLFLDLRSNNVVTSS